VGVPTKERTKERRSDTTAKGMGEGKGAQWSEGAAPMCIEGWTTPREVVTFVECRGCDYKGTKTEKNRGQGFLGKVQLCNMWCRSCKKAWN